MNNHYFYTKTLSTFLFILIFTQLSYSQKNTAIPIFEGKIVTELPENQLKKNFNRQEIFELPTRELSALVQGKSKLRHSCNDRKWHRNDVTGSECCFQRLFE